MRRTKNWPLSDPYPTIYTHVNISLHLFKAIIRKEYIASEWPTASSVLKMETAIPYVTLTALHWTSRRHQNTVELIIIGVRSSASYNELIGQV